MIGRVACGFECPACHYDQAEILEFERGNSVLVLRCLNVWCQYEHAAEVA